MHNRLVPLSPLSVVSFFIVRGVTVGTSAFFHSEQECFREGSERRGQEWRGKGLNLGVLCLRELT